jgi:fructose/tagatose bisphosphate aldolase
LQVARSAVRRVIENAQAGIDPEQWRKEAQSPAQKTVEANASTVMSAAKAHQ